MVEQTLSDLAYEAAIVPERWETFLDAASSLANARGGVLVSVNSPAGYSASSPALAEAMQAFASEGWGIDNPQIMRAMASGQTHFQHDRDLFTDAERQAHEWFTVFWEKWDFGASLGTILDLPIGGKLLFTMERGKAAGPFSSKEIDLFNRFYGDISRSISFASEVLFREYANTTSMLQMLGIPAAVVAHNRTLLSANPLFEKLIPQVAQDARNRLRFTAPRADRLLQNALARLRPDLWTGVTASFPLAAPDLAGAPIVVHVLPVRGVAHDFIHGGAAVVILSEPRPNLAPSIEMLKQLYDLSPSQAKVAAALVNHRGSYADVASSLALSKETVRTHSKAVYQKLGMDGAMDLLALVSQIRVKE